MLVIEDDQAICGLVTQVLADEGYHVLGAADGAEALQLLQEAGEHPPDLILLDWHLPDMSGSALAAAYRRLPPPHAPLVILTGADGGAECAE